MTRKHAKVRVLLPSLQKDTAASPFRFTGKMPDMREHSATLHGCSDTRWLLLAIRYPAIGPGWRDGMQFDQLTRREVISLLGGAAAWRLRRGPSSRRCGGRDLEQRITQCLF